MNGKHILKKLRRTESKGKQQITAGDERGYHDGLTTTWLWNMLSFGEMKQMGNPVMSLM